MSLELYDRALVAKFNHWTYKTDIHVYGPDETRQLIEMIADTTGDKPLTLPLISISRSSGYEIINMNKRVLTYDGLMTESNVKHSISLNAIPINILYQVDVWTRYQKEADEYMRNIIFNIINYPTLQIDIPYNKSNLVHNSSIRLATNVTDSSGSNKLVPHQFTRLSIGISIDDAYLWDARVRNNLILVDELPLEMVNEEE